MVPACNKHSVYREERKEKASTKEGGSYMRSSLVLFWSSLLLPMFKITEEVLPSPLLASFALTRTPRAVVSTQPIPSG